MGTTPLRDNEPDEEYIIATPDELNENKEKSYDKEL